MLSLVDRKLLGELGLHDRHKPRISMAITVAEGLPSVTLSLPDRGAEEFLENYLKMVAAKDGEYRFVLVGDKVEESWGDADGLAAYERVLASIAPKVFDDLRRLLVRLPTAEMVRDAAREGVALLGSRFINEDKMFDIAEARFEPVCSHCEDHLLMRLAKMTGEVSPPPINVVRFVSKVQCGDRFAQVIQRLEREAMHSAFQEVLPVELARHLSTIDRVRAMLAATLSRIT